MSIDPEFLQGLVCPVCRGKLAAAGDDWLECRGCGRAYPVRDGFPILLPDAARTRKDTDGPGASATPPSR